MDINFGLLDGHTQYEDGSWTLKLQTKGLKRLSVKNCTLGEEVVSRLKRRQMGLEYERAKMEWANETTRYWVTKHYFD